MFVSFLGYIDCLNRKTFCVKVDKRPENTFSEQYELVNYLRLTSGLFRGQYLPDNLDLYI